MIFNQVEYDVRCEWGLRGLQELAPVSDVLVIVDVLSFTTAVDIATSRGGVVFPYPLRGDAAATYAAQVNATLASKSRGEGLSLSPTSLQRVKPGCRLVLPSPNGAALAFAAEHAIVLAACLRNAAAAAAVAMRLGSKIAVIPAGERWETGELRPCVEDLLGAGVVIAALKGRRSPEAMLAEAAFQQFQPRIAEALRECSSGRELIEWGFAADVELAADLNVSTNVPRLNDHAFVAA
jgi:2-phosphosulfolactate phosphatase